MFSKGDLLLPTDIIQKKNWLAGLFHPAVVWQDSYDGFSDFYGIMLTKSKKYPNNVPMLNEHFEKRQEGQKKYRGYNKSRFVNQIFLKFGRWGTFEKVGSLTNAGIEFIEQKLVKNEPLQFTEYYPKQLIIGKERYNDRKIAKKTGLSQEDIKRIRMELKHESEAIAKQLIIKEFDDKSIAKHVNLTLNQIQKLRKELK